MNKITKIIAIVLTMVMLATCFFGCKKTPKEDPASASPTPEQKSEIEYEPETTAFVAKVGGDPVYESEFYYFLYQGIREIYMAAEDLYDATLSDEENMQNLIKYFNSEAEDGKTYIQKAVDITLDACVGFKIATKVGKNAAANDVKYAITTDKIQEVIDYVHSEAEYAASSGYVADEYFKMYYGMNVNDAIRYSTQQLYAEMGETAWSDENGWSIDMNQPIAPEEPLKPEELGEDATEEQKAEYEETLKKYEEDMKKYPDLVAAYEKDMEIYAEKLAEYWEKFRPYFEKEKGTYDIATIRYLYIPKGDDAAAAKKNAENYINYFKNGESFENLVKGFSKSPTATEDLGLIDVDLYNAEADYNIPIEVIEWADAATGVTEDLEIIETEDAIYLVKVEGYTDFDKSVGTKAAESTTEETVRANVEYVVLSEEYNAYIKNLMSNEEFEVTETNNDRMIELANEYLNFSA